MAAFDVRHRTCRQLVAVGRAAAARVGLARLGGADAMAGVGTISRVAWSATVSGVYAAGLMFWLLAIHWLRLPHPLTSIGWVAPSLYLALFVPVFVGISRVAVHRLALPLWLAAPAVWTGLELARAHLLTGFLMGSLAHSQVNWVALIQCGDLVGEYGVDFLIVLVAASVVSAIWPRSMGLRRIIPGEQPLAIHPLKKLVPHPAALLPGAVGLCLVLIYGSWRVAQVDVIAQATTEKGPRVALIQGNSLAEWKHDPDRESQIMKEYIGLSERAVADAAEIGRWPAGRFGHLAGDDVSQSTCEISMRVTNCRRTSQRPPKIFSS